MFVWLLVEYAAYASLYDKTYRAAYSLAASGRLKLAGHIRHLSLGFLGKRDPGDLTNLILSDYGQVEQYDLSQSVAADQRDCASGTRFCRTSVGGLENGRSYVYCGSLRCGSVMTYGFHSGTTE
ncbi:hypothetical protein ACH0BY_12570 [Paenibacillus amylolyticus]|uniref:hypothetical protein n=1 Tax=Paenibacillus amylolyticus TaxID=1451 RepID=UPI003879B2FC